MTARTKTLALLAAGTTVVGGAAGTAAATAGPDAKTRPGGDGAAKHRSHHGKELRKLARALDVRPGELRKALREASEESADAGLEKFASVVGATPDQVRDALEKVQDRLTGDGGPEEPGTPTTPTTPEQPTTPTTPSTPEQPATPTTPEQPTTPEAPTTTAPAPDPGTTTGEAQSRTPGGSTSGEGSTRTPEGGEPGAGTEQKLNAFVEALAEELGVEPAKVVEAGKQAREAGKEAFVATLAEELDVDEDEVTEALERVKPDRGAKPGGDTTPGTTQPGTPGGGTGTPAPAV